jgi:hypothetical protein
MRTYHAFYKGKKHELQAESSYAAQQAAAKYFKAKKAYDVAIVLADVPVQTNSL